MVPSQILQQKRTKWRKKLGLRLPLGRPQGMTTTAPWTIAPPPPLALPSGPFQFFSIPRPHALWNNRQIKKPPCVCPLIRPPPRASASLDFVRRIFPSILNFVRQSQAPSHRDLASASSSASQRDLASASAPTAVPHGAATSLPPLLPTSVSSPTSTDRFSAPPPLTKSHVRAPSAAVVRIATIRSEFGSPWTRRRRLHDPIGSSRRCHRCSQQPRLRTAAAADGLRRFTFAAPSHRPGKVSPPIESWHRPRFLHTDLSR
jgi:hypothetical protein